LGKRNRAELGGRGGESCRPVSGSTSSSPATATGAVAEFWRGAALSGALGALRGSVVMWGGEWSGCEGGEWCGCPFIGGRRASGGTGRWRRPTRARGLASSRGTVMTSAGWRQQGGETRGRAGSRGVGQRERGDERVGRLRARGKGFQGVPVPGSMAILVCGLVHVFGLARRGRENPGRVQERWVSGQIDVGLSGGA
jgi:hypothetical protein